MARKPSLSLESLEALGAPCLAALISEEATNNAAFKRRVMAALAGQSGAGAVAKLIDRRLAGLARARAFVDWDKERAFRDDLAALVASIATELAAADPAMAADRLLRFIATHERVFERIDDSSGRIQDVYADAIDALGPVAARMSSADTSGLPAQIMAALGDSEHGYLPKVADKVIPHLPPAARAEWDADLAARIAERHAAEAGKRASGRWFYSMTEQWRRMRQALARAGGDLDQVIALEREKPEASRDSLGIAAQLLAAGRATEALDWVRAGGQRRHSVLMGLDGEDETDASPAVQQALLEAEILTALGQVEAAQALRWQRFGETLAPELLRAHLKALPDFDDIEAEEAAFALALDHADLMAALRFFLAWPRDDLAARVVVRHRAAWSGSDWHILPPIADRLQHESPLAATILYRALLDDILARSRSKAYGHAVKYLAALDRLAADSDTADDRPADLPTQEQYREGLRATHGRKSGFWVLVEGRVTREDPVPRSGRRPNWTAR